MAINIAEVQTLRGIVLFGGDFNAHIATLPNTIDTSDLCELLQVLELAESKQPSVMAKRQNRDASVGGWGREIWTYVVTLGCSSSMVEHLVMNQGSSLAWQMGGIALSIILLAHLQFGKLLHNLR
jgi:hypothetical protein